LDLCLERLASVGTFEIEIHDSSYQLLV
jgi:hypothetical protein